MPPIVVRSPAPDDVPPASTNPRPYIALGLVVVLSIFGGIGTWASVAPLSGAIIAPGMVTVISNRKTVQHFEGGIVSELLVRDGHVVERGQALLRLDDTRAQAALGVLDTHLDLLRAREQRLVAERDGREAVRPPATLADRSGEPEVVEILMGQRQLFEARRAALRGEVQIFVRRSEQLREEIEGLLAQQSADRGQIALVDDELVGQRQLHERGFAAKGRLRELERELERLRGELGENTAGIARAENAIGETDLRIIQLEKDFREEVVSELHEVQGRIFDLEDRRVAALDELNRLVVRAPQAGSVVNLRLHTVGGVLAPGDPILDIVPDDDELVVEAQVRPDDIDKVSVGGTASVRLTALDLRNTPRLAGEVLYVSADRMTDRATGVPYYLMRTRIPDSELSLLGDLRLVPGMPAETFVETGARTMLSYVVKPLTDGMARAFRED
jgi:HlyD family secretion protein/epimerase transport system membrane fusion protein